jgi:DNA topoisomerase-1
MLTIKARKPREVEEQVLVSGPTLTSASERTRRGGDQRMAKKKAKKKVKKAAKKKTAKRKTAKKKTAKKKK